MREADRPIEQRVSVLDRPAADSDAIDTHLVEGFAHQLDLPSIRLALVADDLHVYVGLGTHIDSLFLGVSAADGSGGGIGPRSTLLTHGATRQGHGGARGYVIVGIVPDIVTAVRVGGLQAELVNNVYFARASLYDEISLTAADGRERTMPPVPRPSPGRSTTNRLPGPNRSLGT